MATDSAHMELHELAHTQSPVYRIQYDRLLPISNSHSTLTLTVSAEMAATTHDYRLPTNVKPLHYDLTIHTDLARKTFSGYGSIQLRINTLPLSHLVFNANKDLILSDLKLSTSALKTDSTYAVPEDKVSRDNKEERVTVDLADSGLGGAGLKVGDEVTLSLGWKSKLGTSMVGVSRCTPLPPLFSSIFFRIPRFLPFSTSATPDADERPSLLTPNS